MPNEEVATAAAAKLRRPLGPRPGSQEAAAAGCICDPASASEGWVDVNCPMHGDVTKHWE